jgi:hypothetical protein
MSVLSLGRLLRCRKGVLVILTLLILFSLGLVNAASEPPKMEWSKTYGTYDGHVVIQTADGGYAVAGVNATHTDRGYGDYAPLLIKTSPSGELEWGKTYGVEFGVHDAANSVVQTKELGYVLGGHGGWVLKVDAEGTVQWNYTSGLQSSVVIQASDGDYVLAGYSWFNMQSFAALLKIDENGNLLWNRTLGEDLFYARAQALIETNDGGYAVAGSLNGFWFVETDSKGNLELNQTYNVGEAATAIAEVKDGGYILAGNGGNRAWLVKLDSLGNMQWNRSYDNPPYADFSFSSVEQTTDGGYIAAGGSALIKMTASGEVQWNLTGDSLCGAAYSVVVTEDGGFAVAGQDSGNVVWLAKFAPESQFSGSAVLIVAGLVAVTIVAVAFVVYERKHRTTA